MATNNAWNSQDPAQVSKGGTGRATLTNHGVLVGATTSAITQLSVGTSGQVLVGSSAADPVFATLTSGNSSITYTTGAGTLAIAVTQATTSQLGGSTLATNAEAIAGTDTAKIITADDLKAKLGTQTNHGVLVGAGTTAAVTALSVGGTGTLLVGSSAADPAFATSAVGDFSFTSSTAGATRTFTVSNTDNTNTASTSLIQSTTGGASAGDALHTYTISGATSFSTGIDNSASDAFKISASTALGTTDTVVIQSTGEINYPLQSAFLAVLSSGNDTNASGNGAVYTIGTNVALTEIFDQNNDFSGTTFTAPVTGRYHFSATARFVASTLATTVNITTVTSNRSYSNSLVRAAVSGSLLQSWSNQLADMDAADTVTWTCLASGEAGNTLSLSNASNSTMLSGYLAC